LSPAWWFCIENMDIMLAMINLSTIIKRIFANILGNVWNQPVLYGICLELGECKDAIRVGYIAPVRRGFPVKASPERPGLKPPAAGRIRHFWNGEEHPPFPCHYVFMGDGHGMENAMEQAIGTDVREKPDDVLDDTPYQTIWADEPVGGVVGNALTYGVNVCAWPRAFLTPLHVATYMSRTELIKHLVDHGADVNEQGLMGCTALHIAALHGLVQVAAALVKHEADKTIRNDFGETAYDIAVSKGHNAIAGYLKEQPAASAALALRP